MGRQFGKIAIGAAIIGAAFVTGGAALLPAISTAGVAGGVGAVSIGAALSTTALGSTLLLAGGGMVLQGVAGAAGLGPKAPASTLSALDRLNATLVPSAPRKAVYGYGALATDIRYVEPSGENQEYIDYIVAVAAHRVTSITGIFFEDLQAWSSATGVAAKYAGYLTVETRLEGTAANAVIINGGAKWGANRRLTGCAYVHIRIKRTGNSKKAESPLAGGLPSRVTITGAGMPVYDPRYDSTVTGGSGPQRAGDQSTWAYDYAGGNQGSNPALQTLAHLLGWRINGKLSVGNGVPPARIDLASFGIAASLCYEGVTKVDGSVISRYVGAGVISEDDAPQGVLTSLATSCNGRLRDSGGKLSLVVMHNDLAAAAADDGLNDDHVLSGFEWRPDISLDQTYNIVRGRFCDPSANSLYQLVDYPEVSLPGIDGIDRILPLDLPWVDDASRAQRIAKQVLQRRQYPGAFSATFGPEAWRYQVGDVLPLTFSALGFNRKLFRVAEQTPGLPDGTCPMVLTVEHPSIYAWDRDESAAVQAAEPIRYDPLNNPIILGIEQASTTAVWTQVADDGGKPDDYADVTGEHTSLDTANVYGRPAPVLIDDLDRVVADLTQIIPSVFDLAKSLITANAVLQAKTTLDGKAIGTIVVDVRDVTESMVEEVHMIGAKNAGGTVFLLNMNTVYTDATTSLGQRFEQIEAYADDGLMALNSSLAQTIVDGDHALSQQLDTVQASLGGPDGLAAQVSFLRSAVVTAGGDTIAKAVLSINAAGRVSGLIATNDGTTSSLDLDFDAFRLFRPDGTLLIQTKPGDGRVYIPNAVIDTLEVNTAVVPVRTASTSPVSGAHTDPQSPPARSTVLSVQVVMPVPGWIEPQAFGQQGYAGTSPGDAFPYGATISVNGAQIPEAVAGGASPDNNFSMGGFFYAATPGTYTVTLDWGGITNITLNQRVLFVKGYPFTE